ncbi:hypothetical protein J2S58_000356 [Nakamurella flavida]|nr:hypothetical protein [Nakamurella flavida]
MDRRSGLAVQTSASGVHEPQLLLGTQPVHAVAAGRDAGGGQLVGDEPVPELGVVVVDVDRGVDQVRVVPVASTDRVGAPLVERLLGASRAPGRSPRPGSGPRLGLDQRVHHFGRVSREKWAVARRSISFSCSSCLVRSSQLAARGLQVHGRAGPGRRRRAGDVVMPVGDLEPPLQAARGDTELLATCAIGWSPWRATATTSRRNSGGNGLGTVLIFPARPEASQERSQPKSGQSHGCSCSPRSATARNFHPHLR